MSPPPGRMSSRWPRFGIARVDPVLRSPNGPAKLLPERPTDQGGREAADSSSALIIGDDCGGDRLMGALLSPYA
eukprot:9497082-Pyramimonas_sp.AAC.1